MNALPALRPAAAFCLCALAAACAGLRSAEPLPRARANSTGTAAATAEAAPAEPARAEAARAEAAAAETAAADTAPAGSAGRPLPADRVGTPEPMQVPCIIPPTEPKTKSQVKARSKNVRPGRPPPAAAAPVVSGAPQAGVVEARVERMPVSVMSILGKQVQSPKGEDLGRVVDVLADAAGRVRVAIIDFGGFLGVGDRRIAVDWPLLRFDPNGKEPSLELGVSREQLQRAPEYKDNPRPETLAEPQTPAPGAVDAPQ